MNWFKNWSYDEDFVNVWNEIDQKLTLCRTVQMVACARERKKCEEVSILMTILTRDWVENQTDSCQKCIPTRILEIHTHIKLNLKKIIPYVWFGFSAWEKSCDSTPNSQNLEDLYSTCAFENLNNSGLWGRRWEKNVLHNFHIGFYHW